MTKKLPVPLKNRLLLDIKETTAGGIAISQGAQIQEIGTILAIGKEYEGELKVGDVIHFKGWSIDIIALDGEKFYYLDPMLNSICGIVRK